MRWCHWRLCASQTVLPGLLLLAQRWMVVSACGAAVIMVVATEAAVLERVCCDASRGSWVLTFGDLKQNVCDGEILAC